MCDLCSIGWGAVQQEPRVFLHSATYFELNEAQADTMGTELLSTTDAARRLGISRATLYDWLAQSNAGTFVLRGLPTTIQYYQGGRSGQGRIKIEPQEIERLLNLMKVSPKTNSPRQPPRPMTPFQHITTKLGRPND